MEYRDGDQNAEATVQLGALLVAEIDVQPAALNLICGEGAWRIEITLCDRRAKKLLITSVQTSSPT